MVGILGPNGSGKTTLLKIFSAVLRGRGEVNLNGRSIEAFGKRELSRLFAVVPHETTHVVLAGAFGERLVPRWVDEGMAVLSEPRQKVQRHLDNLVRCRQNDELFHVKDLMLLDDYPRNPRFIGAFYAQSVSLVEFLADQKGAQEFTLFLHDSMRYGEEKALERHYGYRSFAELEQQWFQTAFRDQAAGRQR